MKSISKNYWARSNETRFTEEYTLDLFVDFSFNLRRIILLEFSQYLENFLWPNLNPDQVNIDFCTRWSKNELFLVFTLPCDVSLCDDQREISRTCPTMGCKSLIDERIRFLLMNGIFLGDQCTSRTFCSIFLSSDASLSRKQWFIHSRTNYSNHVSRPLLQQSRKSSLFISFYNRKYF